MILMTCYGTSIVISDVLGEVFSSKTRQTLEMRHAPSIINTLDSGENLETLVHASAP